MGPLILASTSTWRLRMLRDAGVAVEAEDPGVDEAELWHDDPVQTARLRARAKASAVAHRRPDAWVLGADQVVHDGRQLFGKPPDPDTHAARLRAMRGRAHTLHTAWALLGPGDPVEQVARTTLFARADVTDDEIQRYVATGEARGCAGGYALEQTGAFLFERVEGDFFNVLGLPLLDVMTALRRKGWQYPS